MSFDRQWVRGVIFFEHKRKGIMICVDRSRVAGPGESWRKKAAEALARIEAVRREIGPLDWSQRRWGFQPEIYRLAMEPLVRLFHGKCAYCEWLEGWMAVGP